jgi:NADH-quinone oxidoreductase subunit C
MLSVQEIHEKLAAKFREAVLPPRQVQNFDPFVGIRPESLHDVCLWLRDEPGMRFDFLRSVSGVEATAAMVATGAYSEGFSSVYHLYSYEHGHGLTLHVDLGRDPRVRSVSDIWPAADWHEREAYDLMGIIYEGHPYPRRILLPEDWAGHPLRKDYVAPKEYNGLTNE